MDTFNVLLTGELLPGTDLDAAIDRLSALAGLERTKAEQLLTSGQATVVKKGVSAETAQQYQAALQAIGIAVVVEAAAADPAAVGAAPPPPPPPPAGPPRPLQGPDPTGSASRAFESIRVPAGHGWKWMKEAINLFMEEQLLWIGMTMVLSLLVTMVSLIPVLGSLLSSLIGPIFAGGMMLGAHAQQQGEPLEFSYLFRGFSHNRNQLLNLGGLQLLFGFAVGIGIGLIGALGLIPFKSIAMGYGAPEPSAAAALTALALALLLLLAAALAGMAFWFTPCLVAISNRSAWESLRLSFASTLRNWPALLVFSLVSLVALLAVVVVLVLFGTLFHLVLGSEVPRLALRILFLLLFSPTIALFTLTSYTSYRDIFLSRD